MIKKVKLLGISIDNYTVREAMLQVDVFLSNEQLNIIETITTKLLVNAEEIPVVKSCIEQSDLAVIGEKGVLTAAGVKTAQRIKETREHEFLKEFMKRVVRNHKSVYLLGEKKESVQAFQKFLIKEYGSLSIVGSYAMEECVSDVDTVINEMNAAVPDVILSILPVPEQEKLLMAHKDKLNANIWYSIGEEYAKTLQAGGVKCGLMYMIHNKHLRWKNNKYEEEQ